MGVDARDLGVSRNRNSVRASRLNKREGHRFDPVHLHHFNFGGLDPGNVRSHQFQKFSHPVRDKGEGLHRDYRAGLSVYKGSVR